MDMEIDMTKSPSEAVKPIVDEALLQQQVREQWFKLKADLETVTRTSEQTDKLWPAYLEALKAIDPVVKTDSEMSVTRDGTRIHHYASRAKILEHIWKPLLEAGLILTQAPTRQGEDIVVETRITHAVSGQWVSASLPAKAGETPHQVGTAVTYLQRYTLCGLIPLAADEDHDDPSVNEPAPNPFGNPDDIEKANLKSEKELGKNLGRVEGKYFAESKGGGAKKTAAHKLYAPHPKAKIHKILDPSTGKMGYFWFLPPEHVKPDMPGPQLSPEDQADADALFQPPTPAQQKAVAVRRAQRGHTVLALTNAGYETLDKLIVMFEERHPGIEDASEAVQEWLLSRHYSNAHLNDPPKAEEIIAKARMAKP